MLYSGFPQAISLTPGSVYMGEGNGKPLQYSCLENPMDEGAWWATVHAVTTSRSRLHFHFSLSCTGEGSGNPLQCSCLENPRDGGAWWAAVFGVSQSWTQLKQLSSSSSRRGENEESRKNEQAGPKQKQCPAVDVSGGKSKA